MASGIVLGKNNINFCNYQYLFDGVKFVIMIRFGKWDMGG